MPDPQASLVIGPGSGPQLPPGVTKVTTYSLTQIDKTHVQLTVHIDFSDGNFKEKTWTETVTADETRLFNEFAKAEAELSATP